VKNYKDGNTKSIELKEFDMDGKLIKEDNYVEEWEED